MPPAIKAAKIAEVMGTIQWRFLGGESANVFSSVGKQIVDIKRQTISAPPGDCRKILTAAVAGDFHDSHGSETFSPLATPSHNLSSVAVGAGILKSPFA